MCNRRGWWGASCLLVVALMLCGPRVATSEDGNGGDAGGSSAMTADQLQKLVAPVALYPDKLLSNVLRAATVPIQIVQADRYLDKKSSGGDADESQTKNWNPSVQALLHYPKVLKHMSEKLDWTTELGQAVIAQQKAVTAAVQADRARAAQQNALKSNDQVQVSTKPAPSEDGGTNDGGTDDGNTDDGSADDGSADDGSADEGDGADVYYSIASTDPSVTYVPTYDPAVLYPAYRGAGAAVAWGAGVATGAWLAGGFHWGSGDITVNRNVNMNGYRNNVWHHPNSLNQAWRQGAHRPASWQHAGDIGSFGDPRGRQGAGARGAAGAARRHAGEVPGGHPGDQRGRFGGGFHGGSPGAHFGQVGGNGFGGHGGSAFSGLGGGGFESHASARGGLSRGGFGAGGRAGGGFGGGGFRGGRRR